jgi:hypothetical protein
MVMRLSVFRFQNFTISQGVNFGLWFEVVGKVTTFGKNPIRPPTSATFPLGRERDFYSIFRYQYTDFRILQLGKVSTLRCCLRVWGS